MSAHGPSLHRWSLTSTGTLSLLQYVTRFGSNHPNIPCYPYSISLWDTYHILFKNPIDYSQRIVNPEAYLLTEPLMAIQPLRLRVRPSLKDPSKRIISTVLPDKSEAAHPVAQVLWDDEQMIQREMGVEKFHVHTYLLQSQVSETEHAKSNGINERIVMIVEFVDSGRTYIFETRYGVSNWCFEPTLGGVDYGDDGIGLKGNLYGFKPHVHDYFQDYLIPVTTRTFRSLAALLKLRRPHTECKSFHGTHNHYVVNIHLKSPGKVLNTVCTTHIICENTLLQHFFEVLCSPSLDGNFYIEELGWDGNHVPKSTWDYNSASQYGVWVADLGWNRHGYVIRLLAHPGELKLLT